MLTVNVNPDVKDKLFELLKGEPAETCLRLKEFTVGSGCHVKILHSLCTDEFDELADEKTESDSIPFIASEEFIEQNGDNFNIIFDGNMLLVEPVK